MNTTRGGSNGAGGNEYTGDTTINSGAVLVVARATVIQGNSPGAAYTINGGGNVIVNGGTLASAPTSATTYAGGVAGTDRSE